MNASDIPAQARALRTKVTDSSTVELSIVEVDVPAPGPTEVVVRVDAAPINPSDLGMLFAGGDIDAATAAGGVVTLPLTDGAARAAAGRVGQAMAAGNEGAGTVVAAGADAQQLIGKVVAMFGGELYAQYRVLDAGACLPLPDGATAADGAASFVNPMTVVGMVETMRAEGHSALVHTAAASALGQMLVRYTQAEGIELVCIVRSAEHVALLRDLGAQHVLDSTAASFRDDLVQACADTGATLAFDAIGGGPLAGQILSAMEAASSAGAAFDRYGSMTHKQVYIYGSLNRATTELDRSYGMAWGVGGWVLPQFLARAGGETFARMRQTVADGLLTTFATTFTDDLSLDDLVSPESIKAYGRPRTGTKYLLRP